jgi:inorganic pyrophosphatase
MNEQEIIHLALENLHKNAQIQGKWEGFDHREPDGQLILDIDNHPVRYYVEIKNELRNHHLQHITAFNQQYNPLMVVATDCSPKSRKNSGIKTLLTSKPTVISFLKTKLLPYGLTPTSL